MDAITTLADAIDNALSTDIERVAVGEYGYTTEVDPLDPARATVLLDGLVAPGAEGSAVERLVARGADPAAAEAAVAKSSARFLEVVDHLRKAARHGAAAAEALERGRFDEALDRIDDALKAERQLGDPTIWADVVGAAYRVVEVEVEAPWLDDNCSVEAEGLVDASGVTWARYSDSNYSGWGRLHEMLSAIGAVPPGMPPTYADALEAAPDGDGLPNGWDIWLNAWTPAGESTADRLDRARALLLGD